MIENEKICVHTPEEYTTDMLIVTHGLSGAEMMVLFGGKGRIILIHR